MYLGDLQLGTQKPDVLNCRNQNSEFIYPLIDQFSRNTTTWPICIENSKIQDLRMCVVLRLKLYEN